MLRKLLNEERPAFVGVAWDLEGPTFRHDRFAEYKSHRPPLPADLMPQFDYAKEICNGFRIPALELPGYEADDLIATYARLASEAGYPVVVVASDKDLLQLVGDGITVLNPSKDLRLDAAGVAAQFGAPPDRVIDVLGLMGDAVDNIPGVPGVGEKTALALVAAHGGMESILERAKRFVAAFAARDTLMLAIEAEGAELAEPREAFVAAARALLEIDRDPDLPQRLRDAVERASFQGELVGKERKALCKVLRDLDKGSQRRTWQAIAENAEQALLSRELATVDRHAPVAFDPETMRLGNPDRERLATVFKTLGFRSLTAEFADVAPKAAVEAAAVATEEGEADYTAIMTLADLDRAVTSCRAAGRIAVDTETESIDPMRAKLVGMSLSWAPRQGVYIPIGHSYLGVPNQLDLDDVRL